MSIASSILSQTSVSYYGEEVNVEAALDDVFKLLGDNLNHMHVFTREICMMLDQDSDYIEGVKKSDQINDNIDGMNDLFRELKSVVKQISVKPENQEEKDLLKAHLAQRKLEKQMEKANMAPRKKAVSSDLTEANLANHK
jgi:hypothetical protein